MRRTLWVLWLLVAVLLVPQSTRAAPKSYLLEIAPIYQDAYQDTLFEWKGEPKSVANSGCGAVCVAMIQDYYTPDTAQGPEELMRWAYDNGRYRGNGLSINTMVEMLAMQGIGATYRALDANSLRRVLRKDCPVIVYVGKGYFTDGGHYMVICGLNARGRVTIIDPNSEEKSARTYPFAFIDGQVLGKASYIVCEKLESPELSPKE